MIPTLVILLFACTLLLARRARERVTRRTARDLRTIFETAPIGSLVLDAEDRIVSANPALARIAGCDADELTGRTLDALVTPADVPLLRIALAELRHGVSPALETEIRLCANAGDQPVTTAIHAAALAGGDRQRLLLQVLDVTERKRVEAQLQHMADHDPLTGLFNRRRFEQELVRHVAHAQRYGAEGAAMVLDVDRFKSVNDTYGHGAGDRLIERVAQTLNARLRTTDMLARLGGDEFAILLPKADRDGAEALARQLVEAVRTCDPDGAVTISVGVVVFADLAELGAATIVAAADAAMYEAKSAGRDRYACFATGTREGIRITAQPTVAV